MLTGWDLSLKEWGIGQGVKSLAFQARNQGFESPMPCKNNKMKQIEQVREWTEKTKVLPIYLRSEIDPDILDLREKLMREELDELIEAMRSKPLSDVLKEASDVLYVLIGTILEYGAGDIFPLVFDEVQRSNMSKFVDGQVLRREDGKILKGPNYSPADIDSVIIGYLQEKDWEVVNDRVKGR